MTSLLDVCILARQSTAAQRFGLVSFVDVNPARTTSSRGLSTTSQTPSSRMTEISSCRQCNPNRKIVWEKCLGLFTHWLVTASLMHACNVAITLLKDEQINFTVGFMFPMPQFRMRIHRGILHFQVARIAFGLTFKAIRLSASVCGFLLKAFRIGFCRSFARHGVPLGHQSAFQYQVSNPSALDLTIKRVCVDKIHSNCRVTKLFKPCFADVDVAGSFIVAVIRFWLEQGQRLAVV